MSQKEKHEVPRSSSSHSQSLNYGNQFLNISSDTYLDGFMKDHAETEINSLLDVQIQQKIPLVLSAPLLDVLVSVIPPQKNTKPTPLTTPIHTPPITSMIPPVKSSLPATKTPDAPIPPSELKQVDHSIVILESIKSQVPHIVNEYLGSSLRDSLQKVLQKHTEELKQELKQKDTWHRAVADMEEPDEEHVHDMSLDVKENIVDETGNADKHPDGEAAPKNDWFKQPPRPPTPDLEWNKCQVIDDQPKQTCLMIWWSDQNKRVTKVGYDKDDERGIKHWGPKRQLFYRSQLNRFLKHDVYYPLKILSVVSVTVNKLHGYGYLEEIMVRSIDRQLYKFKEGDFVNLYLNDIEDMLLDEGLLFKGSGVKKTTLNLNHGCVSGKRTRSKTSPPPYVHPTAEKGGGRTFVFPAWPNLKKFKKDAPCQAFKNQERHRLKGESSPSQRLKGESSPSPLLVSTRRNQQHLGRAFT
ncbi:hypothetical protein Tco_0563657 [Tanacetum coccineum]